MSNGTKKPMSNHDTITDVQAETSFTSGEDETVVATEDSQNNTPSDSEAKALTEEVSDLKDRLLRVLAESENMRRRTEREVADAKTYSIANFAREILNVADNIQRAQSALTKEDTDSASGAFKTLIEGVALTQQDLQSSLSRFGIKKLEPEGQKFDPNMHQAMFELEDDKAEAGTVVKVIQEGYILGERVLRPAMVGVAKSKPN